MKKPVVKWIVMVLCIALLLGGGFGFYRVIAHRAEIRQMEAAVDIGVFYDGISVGGVDVGGMTAAQAREALEDVLRERYASPAITIVYDGRQWTFSAYDLLDPSAVDTAFSAAWAYARDGELADRYRRVMALHDTGRDFPIATTYTAGTIGCEMALIAREVDIPAQDACIRYDSRRDDAYSLVGESEGRETDIAGTLSVIRKRIADKNWGTVPLVVRPLTPKVRLDDLIIVDFATSIAGNTESRAHNVRLALAQLDGYVLGPEELFSFNEIVGDRTAAAGFKTAPIINGDKALVPGIGGGTCQASTTTYNAAVRAGMEIVERHHHSFPVGYIDKGLDATVSYGSQDLKFVNPRDTPVYFHTYFENDTVHVVIYGEPFPNGGEIRLSSEVTGTVSPPAPVSRADVGLAPGQTVSYVKSRSGYRVISYKEYYENGELVSRSILNEDYYQPIRGIVLCGPPVQETQLVQ